MSTRSGKRIHGSFHENIVKPDLEQVGDSVKKLRSRRLKENIEEFSGSTVKNKKRSNYVTYPTDDEVGVESSKEDEDKPVRVLRKYVLKEKNLLKSSEESAEPPIEAKKALRTSRRTRRFAEDTQENVQEIQNQSENKLSNEETRKPKKEKKIKKSVPEQAIEEIVISKKKPKKKKGKKAKRSGSMIVEDIEPPKGKNSSLNRSDMSVDSFHSAAGSPQNDIENLPASHHKDLLTNATSERNNDVENHVEKLEGRRTRSTTRLSSINSSLNTPCTVVKQSRKRKSSTKDIDKSIACYGLNENEIDIEVSTNKIQKDPLFNKSKKRKSTIMDTVSEDIISDAETKNSTYDLEDLQNEKSIKNSTIDLDTCTKDSDIIESSNVNTTFDKNNASQTRESDTGILSNENGQSNDKNTTYDKETEIAAGSATKMPRQSVLNTTFEKSVNSSHSDEVKDTTAKPVLINTTFEKETDAKQFDTTKLSINNATFEKDELESKIQPDTPNDIENLRKSLSTQKQSTEMNSTFDKTEKCNSTFDKTEKSNSTFDKTEKTDSTFDKEKKLDTTFDKNSNSKLSLLSSDNSNITIDKSDISRISITSDESKENIINTTPVLIESSMDESGIDVTKLSPKSPAQPITPLNHEGTFSETKLSPKSSAQPITPFSSEGNFNESEIETKLSPKSSVQPITPLKREGTFTKDSSVVESPNPKLSRTPTKHVPMAWHGGMSLPSPGCTPFQIKSVPKDKGPLNVTRSMEKKRRSSLSEPLPRTTKVMFCSPVNNPAVVLQQRRKVIKSNLKGSNKSFVFEENDCKPAPRKRSYTQSDADTTHVKRKRLADEMHSATRLSRCRTSSASAKLTDPGTPPKKPVTPKRPEARIPRTKLPNFAALHQREFAKMESLNECQERRAKRARQLLTPTGAITVLERSSPRENASEPQKSPNDPKEEPKPKEETKEHKKEKRSKEPKKPETPVKSLPTLKSLNPGYSRFGFKLNLDVNPFSIPSKAADKNDSLFNFSNKKDSKAKSRLFSFSTKKDTSKKDNTKPIKDIRANLTRQATLPSISGATSRREVAKQTVMREKSFTDRRNVDRNEIRTVIKGVRTNRRFELQMRMRNLD